MGNCVFDIVRETVRVGRRVNLSRWCVGSGQQFCLPKLMSQDSHSVRVRHSKGSTYIDYARPHPALVERSRLACEDGKPVATILIMQSPPATFY